jgi:hypothetical protein
MMFSLLSLISGFIVFSNGGNFKFANNPDTLYGKSRFYDNDGFTFNYSQAMVWKWNITSPNIPEDLAYISITPYLLKVGSTTPFCSISDPVNQYTFKQLKRNAWLIMYADEKVREYVCGVLGGVCINVPIMEGTLYPYNTYDMVIRLSLFRNQKLKNEIQNAVMPAYIYTLNVPGNVGVNVTAKSRITHMTNETDIYLQYNKYIDTIKRSNSLYNDYALESVRVDRLRCATDPYYKPFAASLAQNNLYGCLGDNRDALYSGLTNTTLNSDTLYAVVGVNHVFSGMATYFAIDAHVNYNNISVGVWSVSSDSENIGENIFYHFFISNNCSNHNFKPCVTILHKNFVLVSRIYLNPISTIGPSPVEVLLERILF